MRPPAEVLVTGWHITHGKRGDPQRCALALAVAGQWLPLAWTVAPGEDSPPGTVPGGQMEGASDGRQGKLIQGKRTEAGFGEHREHWSQAAAGRLLPHREAGEVTTALNGRR
jgi:hypothetical protein